MKAVKKVFISLVVISIAVAALWFTNRAVTPKKATWDDVEAEAKIGGYKLIRTDELYELYSKSPESFIIVDTRQEWEYRSGHIKGAVNFPMEPTRLSRWRKKGNLDKCIGPDKERSVVFY
ncbi:MAG: rhodanese-like domain-containing protein [Deltaproteobacteria bacterium]|nr:rhodanese-like domain-containing protein [Deltaproteobacteria bacterium]